MCTALALSVPALAVADPGTPGLDRATVAVYENSGEAPSLAGGGQGDTNAPQDVAGVTAGSGGDLGRLPFTGLSAALVLAAGLGALSAGVLGRAVMSQRRHS